MLDRRRALHRLATPALTVCSFATATTALATPLESARVLTGFAPGGTVDAVARTLAAHLRGRYALTLQVQNLPGASGRLAVEELRRAPGDGRTLLVTPTAIATLYPQLMPRLPYGPRDLAPVGAAATVSFALAVGPSVPAEVQGLPQFLAWARGRPVEASYGTAGVGSVPHLLMAVLQLDCGVPLTHVPYRGTLPALQDLLGGQVAAVCGPIGDFAAHARAGRLRVLATTRATRSPFLPEVPTFTELGYKAVERSEKYGVFVSARTPQAAVTQAATALQAALATPGLAQAWAAKALELTPLTSAQLAQAVTAESQQWALVLRRTGLRLE